MSFKSTDPQPSYTPIHTSFMDAPMRTLWEQMGPLPADLRLYGGTALALYLDHRPSDDFDFATPSPEVDLSLARTIPWLDGAHLQGGPGMVDATLDIGRPVRITLMETGPMLPHPVHPPIPASNGVAIAHPGDLIRSKVEACLTRDAPRDFVAIAHATRRWPELTNDSIADHIKRTGRAPEAIAKELSAPPPLTHTELTPPDRATLAALATQLMAPATRQRRSKHRDGGPER